MLRFYIIYLLELIQVNIDSTSPLAGWALTFFASGQKK